MMNLLVSICCITYNHENYIRECLDGFLMQQTNFDFEILIHDDASTDSTADIIRNYQIKFPKIIKSIYQIENKYSQGQRNMNLNFNFPRAQGKYIALCEGDDYWTDPLKLQKQVDFLEENKNYGVVCTNYDTSYNVAKSQANKEISIKDILFKNPIGTLTVMFRKNLLQNPYPSIFDQSFSMGDYQLWLWMATFSKVYRLGEVTAFYRILEQSASGRNDLNKKIKYSLDALEITKYFLVNSNLSVEEKNEILRERYGYLFSNLIEHSDRSFLRYQLLYFKDVKRFNLLDLKILIKGLKVYK